MIQALYVKNCGECPAFHRCNETGSTFCGFQGGCLIGRGMGPQDENDPAPDDCPLRKSMITVELVEGE